MSVRDAAMELLDARADQVKLDSRAADELFAVVDLLDTQHPLRRSLSDPSADPASRVALAQRIFGNRISESAMKVLAGLAGAPGLTGRRLVAAVERQGVRGLCKVAMAAGNLPRVQDELHTFAATVEANAELGDILRNRTYPLEARRQLVAGLTKGKVHPITTALLDRATAARVRTLPHTVATYLDIAARLANEQIASVTVARPLDEVRLGRLRRALEAHVGGAVALQVTVDPEVLGGMSVRIGDHIFESTVAGRLDDARRLLNSHQ